MRLLFAVIFLTLSVFGARAGIVYVNAKATGTPHDGKSWATAFTSIPANSAPGTEVWVAGGVYRGSRAFGPGLSCYGGFTGIETSRDQRDWVRNETILDANGAPFCFSTSSLSGRDSTVDGFTIRNVRNHGTSALGAVRCYGATVLRHLTISGLDMWPDAAVIYVAKGGNPLIQDCTISGNPVDVIRCAAGSAVELRGCTLRDNDGAGIYATSANVTAVANTIAGGTYGSGISCYGGTVAVEGNTIQGTANRGIDVSSSKGHITGNRIIGNAGPGISVGGDGILIANNLIADNHSFWGYSGGVYCGTGSPQIVNNTIVGNGGGPDGGGIYISSDYGGATATPLIANNIIAFNDAGVVNGYYPGAPVLRRNCVFGNRSDYMGLPDATGADGNIKADPRLALPDYGNFHIQPDSPCRNAGDASLPPGWPDMDGQPRIQGGALDIGADESDGTLWPTAPAIVRVKPGGSDANDGSSWLRAKRTVQAGLDAIAGAGGGEVWVASGVYGERLRMGAYTRLLATHGRWDPASPRPTVDAAGGGGALTILSGGARTVVDGIAFQNGRAVTGAGIFIGAGSTTGIRNTSVSNCVASSPDPGTCSTGGGISAIAATVTMHDITIAYCSASIGGGLYSRMSIISADRCSFSHNAATTENDRLGGGGGFYASYGSLTLADCAVALNTATGGGGGGSSGACLNGPNSMMRCTFTDNSAGMNGGGLLIGLGGIVMRIADCVFARNKAEVHGGGIYAPFFGGSLIGNTFTGNRASIGGGLALLLGRPVIENNIVAFNSSGIDGGSDQGGYGFEPYWHGSFNCLFSNAGGDYTGPGRPMEGNGNFHADPLFKDAAGGNFQLQPTSPCVDAGNSAAVLPGETDLNGSARIHGRAVDTGAFESAFTAPGLRWPDAWRGLRIAAGLTAFVPSDSILDGDRSGRVDLSDVVPIIKFLSR